jgi:hypothetical protein
VIEEAIAEMALSAWPPFHSILNSQTSTSGSVQTISFELPHALFHKLESEARRRRVIKSHLVRSTMEKVLAASKEGARVLCQNLARDLAGKVKGLPKDLVTNPACLKGFGQ